MQFLHSHSRCNLDYELYRVLPAPTRVGASLFTVLSLYLSSYLILGRFGSWDTFQSHSQPQCLDSITPNIIMTRLVLILVVSCRLVLIDPIISNIPGMWNSKWESFHSNHTFMMQRISLFVGAFNVLTM